MTMPETGAESAGEDITARLAALDDMDLTMLRAEWRRLYRSQAPRLSRMLMIRALAYRLQERSVGGLTPATARRLLAFNGGDEEGSGDRGKARAEPRPGTRLVREWNGRTYTVRVTDEGYRYGNEIYRSLTGVAREITGAHWSGPRFFGLNAKPDGARRRADGGEYNG